MQCRVVDTNFYQKRSYFIGLGEGIKEGFQEVMTLELSIEKHELPGFEKKQKEVRKGKGIHPSYFPLYFSFLSNKYWLKLFICQEYHHKNGVKSRVKVQ